MDLGARRTLVGSVLDGRYRVGGPLGQGGTAVVLAAERLKDGAPVVVKVLREHLAQDPELAGRLWRESEVAGAVVHPGVARVLGRGRVSDGSPYVVAERLRGECLAHLLGRRGRLPVPATIALAIRVAAILRAAHEQGYIHRDVKPEHIVLDRSDNGTLDVRLIDFGVCACLHASAEDRARERGRVYGTPSYVAPEQAAGRPDVDARTDVFALGVVIFEAISGDRPFVAETIPKLLRRIIQEPAPRLSAVCADVQAHAPLDRVVSRAMARVPHQRYGSASELARALVEVIPDRRAAERSLAASLRRTSLHPHSEQTLAHPQLAA